MADAPTKQAWLKLAALPASIMILALTTLAIIFNYLRLPLFVGIEFIFGSVFAVLALVLVGKKAAVLIGSVAAALTIIIWGHPYAWVVFTFEILWLCWRWHSNNQTKLVIADLQFWLCCGIPMIVLLYVFSLDASWQTAILISLKQMSNGIFNVLFACLLLLFFQLHPAIAKRLALPFVGLQQLIFHIFLALTLLSGSVPLVLDARKLRHEYELNIAQQLQHLSQIVRRQLQARQFNATTTTEITAVLNELLPNQQYGLFILDEKMQLLASSGVVASITADLNSEVINALRPGFSQWLPDDIHLRIQRWRQSRYIYLSEAQGLLPGIAYIGIEQAAAEVVDKLEQDSARQLMLLVAFLLLTITVSNFLSKTISKPLRRLDLASKELKANIDSGKSSLIPRSRVEEYSSLAATLQQMSTELTAAFQQSKLQQHMLEQQLSDGTAELQHTNSQLNAILSAASGFAIIAVNTDGVITFFSRGAEMLLGYRADEVVNKQTAAIFHLESEVQQRATELSAELGQPIAGFKTLVAKAEQTGSETREWRYVCKDGHIVPVALTVTLILDASAKITGYLGVAKNISERFYTEKLKNEFISTVSHELRTPLTSIYAAIRMANSGKLGTLPSKVAALLGVAESNSQRLTRLINDLLDIEKLTAGKFQLELVEQPLAPLIQQALDEIASYAVQFQVQLQAELATEPLIAKVDAQRLLQVVTNLLSNAIKFSPADGSVVVALYGTATLIKLEVRDQGNGISEAFKQRIFQKFSQSDAADTRRQGGTGLGLAISKELTEKMGGQIGFESEAGQGAIFWISFNRLKTPDAP